MLVGVVMVATVAAWTATAMAGAVVIATGRSLHRATVADMDASFQLEAAADVVALLGDDLVARYRRSNPGPYVCARCGQEIAGTAQLVCEVEGLPEASVVVTSTTHRSCRPSGVVGSSGLAGVLDLERADVALVSRPAPAPRALLLIDFVSTIAAFPAGSADPVELRVAHLLDEGFGLCRGDLVDASGPRPNGWVVAHHGATLEVVRDREILFTGELEVPSDWSRLASSDRSVLVVAGSQIGLGRHGGPANLDRLQQVIDEGRVAVGELVWREVRSADSR